MDKRRLGTAIALALSLGMPAAAGAAEVGFSHFSYALLNGNDRIASGMISLDGDQTRISTGQTYWLPSIVCSDNTQTTQSTPVWVGTRASAHRQGDLLQFELVGYDAIPSEPEADKRSDNDLNPGGCQDRRYAEKTVFNHSVHIPLTQPETGAITLNNGQTLRYRLHLLQN